MKSSLAIALLHCTYLLAQRQLAANSQCSCLCSPLICCSLGSLHETAHALFVGFCPPAAGMSSPQLASRRREQNRTIVEMISPDELLAGLGREEVPESPLPKAARRCLFQGSPLNPNPSQTQITTSPSHPQTKPIHAAGASKITPRCASKTSTRQAQGRERHPGTEPHTTAPSSLHSNQLPSTHHSTHVHNPSCPHECRCVSSTSTALRGPALARLVSHAAV